jgi:lysozyme family protein
MKKNEAQILLWIAESEGGFAERQEEPGGSVNRGVTLATFDHWRVFVKKMPKPTIDDLRNLTREECDDIYRHLYFVPVKADLLPSGVDYATVDAAVHSGPKGSIRFLQEAIGFKYKEEFPDYKGTFITGEFDDKTFTVMNNINPELLIENLIMVRQARQKKMLDRKEKNLPGFDRELWERGWTRRNTQVRERALKMLDE